MVHGVNAGVAHTTVGAPRRPIELTRGAPLHPHVYVVYEHVLVVAALVVAFVFDHVLYVNYSIPIHQNRFNNNNNKFENDRISLPLGRRPGSMKVAIEKLTST